jgi:hypothetical protein
MAVFRVEKTKDYTVMSNYHLRDTDLSLKAKGLLSLMLSLPDNWDYTTKGLARICKEGVDSICGTVNELEKQEYITRRRIRNEHGQLADIEYTIHEQPMTKKLDAAAHPPKRGNPVLDNPVQAKPVQEKPVLGKPKQDAPVWENPAQLSIDILKTNPSSKEKINTELSSTESNLIPPPNPHTEFSSRYSGCMDAVSVYREVIMENIEYEIAVQRFDKHRLDEIVELILETVCSSRKTIRVAGDDYPAELVKAKFLKLNSAHIEYVFESMDNTASEIHNIKKYLLAVLFNAPSTIGNYYMARVNHDMESEGWS